MSNYRGIDVSKHNGAIDWGRVKAAGIDFALLRLGYGSDQTNQDDPQFAANVAGCEAAGIPWGAYLYSYATNLTEAESEAAHILRLLSGRVPLYPVYIDMEDADGYKAKRGVSAAMCADICELVCRRLTEAGCLAGVYANKDWLVNRLNDTRLDQYERWLAQWASEPSYDKPFGVWQYTSSGNVDGINSRVDCNIAYKDYPGIVKAGRLNGYKPAPAPTPAAATGISAGDTVNYTGKVYGDSYGNSPGKTVSGSFVVDIVKAGRQYGVHIAAGWIDTALIGQAATLRALDDIAREVIAGKWGNGAARKAKLTAEGYDYAAVQARVNEMLK